MNYSGLIFIALGLFAICGAAFDWEWFMGHYKARFMANLFGRSGARIFYTVLGIGACVLGRLMLMNIVDLD